MPSEKYKTLPSPDEASYVLVSMGSIEKHIKNLLKSFPVWDSINPPCAVSTTVLWSGTKGNNVSVQLYAGQLMGVVLDSSRISMPQADLKANGSYGKVVTEIKKDRSFNLTTKYPEKKGYERDYCFVTNLARHKHTNDGASVYLPEGSVAVFAENIWRKRFRLNPGNTKLKYQYLFYNAEKELMRLNEGITFETPGAGNPIMGIIIRQPEDLYELLALKNCAILLLKNPHLGLYLYNPKAEEHIVRYLPHDVAIAYLKDDCLNVFQAFFECAIPYIKKYCNNAVQDDTTLKMNYLFFKETLSPVELIKINYLIHEEIISLETATELFSSEHLDLTFLSENTIYKLLCDEIISLNNALALTKEKYLLSGLSERAIFSLVQDSIISFETALNITQKQYTESALLEWNINKLLRRGKISIVRALKITQEEYQSSALSQDMIFSLVQCNIISIERALQITKEQYAKSALSGPNRKIYELVVLKIISIDDALNITLPVYNASQLNLNDNTYHQFKAGTISLEEALSPAASSPLTKLSFITETTPPPPKKEKTSCCNLM